MGVKYGVVLFVEYEQVESEIFVVLELLLQLLLFIDDMDMVLLTLVVFIILVE